MTLRRTGTALALAVTCLVGPALAADDEAVKKDLTSVIALHGQPCGRVASFQRQGENDYLAVCENGHRYRVYVSPQGRVVVERR